MVTQLNDVAVLGPKGFVVACSWCLPLPRLEQLAREFPAQVSHTICPACTERAFAPTAAV
jgi:hypothetical protein